LAGSGAPGELLDQTSGDERSEKRVTGGYDADRGEQVGYSDRFVDRLDRSAAAGGPQHAPIQIK
jgi:hypothetical protein